MIRYMGSRKSPDGGMLYVFVINGQQKEIRAESLKLYPGTYELLPAAAKAEITATRKWLSKM